MEGSKLIKLWHFCPQVHAAVGFWETWGSCLFKVDGMEWFFLNLQAISGPTNSKKVAAKEHKRPATEQWTFVGIDSIMAIKFFGFVQWRHGKIEAVFFFLSSLHRLKQTDDSSGHGFELPWLAGVIIPAGNTQELEKDWHDPFVRLLVCGFLDLAPSPCRGMARCLRRRVER